MTRASVGVLSTASTVGIGRTRILVPVTVGNRHITIIASQTIDAIFTGVSFPRGAALTAELRLPVADTCAMLARVRVPVTILYLLRTVLTCPRCRTCTRVSRVANALAGPRIQARVREEIAEWNHIITVRPLPRSNTMFAHVTVPTYALATSAVQAWAVIPLAEGNACCASFASPAYRARTVVITVAVAHTVTVVTRVHFPLAVLQWNAARVICAVCVAQFAAVIPLVLWKIGAALFRCTLCTSTRGERFKRVVGN